MSRGGTCYFTLDYVSGFETKLPKEFTGGLDSEGDGCILVRYGAYKIPVIVRKHVLSAGWETFIDRGNIVSGTTLLAAHSVGRNVSLLKFKKGMGIIDVWDLIGDAFDIQSGILELNNLPENALTVTFRTSYFPEYMSLFFSKPSGVCIYEENNYHNMKVPMNLAQHLKVNEQRTVNIRSGQRVFENVEVRLGYFRGFHWRTLVEACELDIGFKIYFFLNPEEEFDMIVIGHENLEAIYQWSRSYYMVI